MDNKKKPLAEEGERICRLKQLVNSDFSGKNLAVKIRYAPENPETTCPAYSEQRSV